MSLFQRNVSDSDDIFNVIAEGPHNGSSATGELWPGAVVTALGIEGDVLNWVERDPGTERAELGPTRSFIKISVNSLETLDMENTSENYSQDSSWFAVWTRSRQEKVAAAMLNMLGVQYYLPLKQDVRQWSDRKKIVFAPLFSGYLFVRMNPAKDSRLQVLKTPGIADFVANNSGPLPIPDQQIEDIRTILASKIQCTVVPIFEEGDFVRVVRGPLAGISGRYVRNNATFRLLISVEMINRSLELAVDHQDVEALCSAIRLN
jgi:transcription antitermination factor NusG